MTAIRPAIRSAIQPAIRSAFAGSYGWLPTSLFAAGEQGVWYDPSDLSTMFQDVAGTVPVTADGQLVARINDKSGRGNHATQATEASRPLYKTSGGLHWLQFDGTDDFLRTAAIDFTATDEASVFLGARKSNDILGMLFELSVNMNANNGAFYFTVNEGTFDWASKSRGDAAESGNQIAYFTEVGAATAVIASTHNISGPLTTIRKNGVAGTSSTANKGAGNFGNYALYIGRRGGSTLPFNGNLYSLTILGRTATAGEIASAETYANSKTGAY